MCESLVGGEMVFNLCFLFFYRFVVGGGPMSYFIMTRRSLDATLSLRVYQYCVNLFLN